MRLAAACHQQCKCTHHFNHLQQSAQLTRVQQPTPTSCKRGPAQHPRASAQQHGCCWLQHELSNHTTNTWSYTCTACNPCVNTPTQTPTDSCHAHTLSLLAGSSHCLFQFIQSHRRQLNRHCTWHAGGIGCCGCSCCLFKPGGCAGTLRDSLRLSWCGRSPAVNTHDTHTTQRPLRKKTSTTWQASAATRTGS